MGVFVRPSSHFSSASHDSAPLSSPSRLGLDQSCTSRSSEASEEARNLPASPCNLVVKEEPCDIDTLSIKWELSEGGFAEPEEKEGNLSQGEESPGVKSKPEPCSETPKGWVVSNDS